VRGGVFIDTGAFVAFLNRADRQHTKAKFLFNSLPGRIFTSILVVSECYSWCFHKLGEPAARTFRPFLSNLPGLQILNADAAHRDAAWERLDRHQGRKLTFVDASILVWLEQHRIPTVWGTDRHVAIEGAAVVPGPPE
jgi:predicted nucleic acid-binding protein